MFCLFDYFLICSAWPTPVPSGHRCLSSVN
jgi:hypothetical protein